MLKLSELERLANEATPGDWAAVEYEPGRVTIDTDAQARLSEYGKQIASLVIGEGAATSAFTSPEETLANARFMAACRKAVPELVRLCRQLGEALEVVAERGRRTGKGVLPRVSVALAAYREVAG